MQEDKKKNIKSFLSKLLVAILLIGISLATYKVNLSTLLHDFVLRFFDAAMDIGGGSKEEEKDEQLENNDKEEERDKQLDNNSTDKENPVEQLENDDTEDDDLEETEDNAGSELEGYTFRIKVPGDNVVALVIN